MAAAKGKAAPVGSAQWIQSEREQAAQFIDQEAEDFGFSMRNDLEWLNAHLAEVFSQNNVTFADIFKTPGKLRGKTPRTARKRDAGQAPRQPLTDIFAPNTNAQLMAPPSARKNNAFYDKVAQFQIAEDQENVPEQRPFSRSKSPQRVGKPGNTDSGYHGMTEDEMDVDAKTETATSSSQETEVQKAPQQEDEARPQAVKQDVLETGRVSDESFLSAKEEIASRNASRAQLRNEPEAEKEDVEMADEDVDVGQPLIGETPAAVEREDADLDIVDEDVVDGSPQTPSDDASSPGKPLHRKSSFTFSALPAREPLTAKRSVGFRESQVDVGRNSVLARSFGAKNVDFTQSQEDSVALPEKAEENKTQQKTTTQLLQERISMLGQTKEPRMSKSIAHNMLGASATYPRLPPAETEPEDTSMEAAVSAKEDVGSAVDAEDEDDDWIAPSKPTAAVQSKSAVQPAPTSQAEDSPKRPAMHQKSISTTQMPSPTRPVIPTGHQKAQSVLNPNLANTAGVMSSTTPMGSPAGKKHHDGPLSASKNRLWSALKTAKNIFASSASASAAAKLEAHNSPAPHRSPKRDFSNESKTAAVYNMPGAMYSEHQLPQSPGKAGSIISASPSRKTRSSNESDKKREKELKAQQKAQQKADSELEKAREKEHAKALKQQEERRKADEAEAAKQAKVQAEAERQAKTQAERPTSAGSDTSEMPPPPPPKSMLPAGKLRAPGRLAKPARGPEPGGRPAPVNIRVTSQSQRLGQQAPNASFSKSQHESMAPPPPPKTGLRTASAQGSVRGSTAPTAGNARGVRALEAAAKKREADEKAAAKKAEQKRELERKRAAKVEEERKAEEERRAAEQARAQDAKLAAQRKAEAEAQRKRDMLRSQQQHEESERRKVQEAHELAEEIRRQRAAQPPHPRGDVGGTLRQLGKNTVPAQNKPVAKRVFQPEDDEPHVQRPGLQRGPPSYQQNDAKRRRTNEEEQHDERHSVMAPPKRPSNMRKESTLNKFPHGYTHAPPPAAHHAMAGGGNSMFRSTVTAQHQLHHAQGKQMPSHPSQTVQMSNARIPFAENANPPAGAHHPSAYQQQQMYAGHENAQPAPGANKFKTPGRPASAPKGAKSSPLYPNGDAIQLPEIMTDSEDEDSEDEAGGGFRAPSWVASPALRDLLTQQQLVDPETVFGPIAELKMEEVFKGGKNAADRMKRFRDRGSSAAWVESGDAVTSAEKRRDMEARERVVKEGGWRFEPNA